MIRPSTVKRVVYGCYFNGYRAPIALTIEERQVKHWRRMGKRVYVYHYHHLLEKLKPYPEGA